MLRKFTKKRWLAALGVVAALVVAGAAVAYFTSGGTGTGSATVGSPAASDIAITGGAPSDVLYPGGAAVNVPIKVTNGGHAAIAVAKVHLASVTAPTGCAASAFGMDDVSVDQTLQPGQSVDVTGHLTMADGGDQNACQNAPLTLNFTSN